MSATHNRTLLSGAAARWRRRHAPERARSTADESAEVYVSLEALLASEPVRREAAATG